LFFLQAVRGLGAGKRARASASNISKDERLQQLMNEFNAKMLQMRSAEQTPVIKNVIGNLEILAKHMLAFPDTCVSDSINRLQLDSLHKISDSVTNSNNTEHKLLVLSKHLFFQDMSAMSRLINDMKFAESTINLLTTSTYTAQYMTESGNADTKKFSNDLIKSLMSASRAQGAASSGASGAAPGGKPDETM